MSSVISDFFLNIFRKIKINLSKIYHARGSAHEIALGAAIGAFWGVFPTFGLSTILSILLYRVFRFNLVVAIAAAFISNPLTSPFLLMISYEVGSYFVESDLEFDFKNWYHQLPHFGLVLMIGATVVSSLTSLVVYFLTKYVIEHRRRIKSSR